MTRNQIAAAVAKDYAFEVELVKGDGYWYFTATARNETGTITFYETWSEYVMYLSAMPAERWIMSGRAFLADCELKLKERKA